MNNTPILLHDHNEFLNENVFLRGIEIYCEIITALGNVEPFWCLCLFLHIFFSIGIVLKIYFYSNIFVDILGIY